MEKEKAFQRGFAGLGLVIEFLAILAVTPGLGYLVDRYVFGSPGPGLGALIGLFVGFIYGLLHLVRRSKTLAAQVEVPERDPRNREGYQSDLGGEIRRIRSDLDEVGRRIDRAQERETRHRE